MVVIPARNNMEQTWEDKFRAWAQAPSKSELERCENAESSIRNAISQSDALKGHDVRVVLQGSYRNRTNVRAESDVDVGVVCYGTLFGEYPAGTTAATFGLIDSDYTYAAFKEDVGRALTDYFGTNSVTRGNKAFNVRETSHHVEADVAPFFEHRRYSPDRKFLSGVELHPDNGTPPKIINWPEQHYANGQSKNERTARRYRGMVRALKCLRNEMRDNNMPVAMPVIGFLSECLVWNVPDSKLAGDFISGIKVACLIISLFPDHFSTS